MPKLSIRLIVNLPTLLVVGLYCTLIISPAVAAPKDSTSSTSKGASSPSPLPTPSQPLPASSQPTSSAGTTQTTSSNTILSSILLAGSAENRSASALFGLTGNTLTIALNNTSQADSLVPTDVLTGLFFNLSGATLSPLAASLGAGSKVYGATSQVSNVGGEWAFGSKLAIGSSAYNYGVSAAGLGLFGPKDRFDTSSNLSGTENVGGLDFGIVTAGDNPTTGNGGLNRDLIKGSVLFTFGLTNVAANFNLAQAISNLRFQYGTATSEPSFTAKVTLPPKEPPIKRVPEPGVMGALLLTGLAMLRTRKQQSIQ
ncbi:MAG: PEP-CTERM sorting domain-containing protein [Phormidesmis sp. CAN_BIN44]|nr:PEP-CTERM sorting domain-containing protein [Phormidesmis sp. CAN_BIN44]